MFRGALRFAWSLPLLAACGGAETEPPLLPGPPVALKTEPAAERDFAVTYRASGTVRGRATATLTSKTVGFVRAVHVRPGDVVRAGQPLAELEASDARAGVARARAALATALAGKVEAESALAAAAASAQLAKTSFDRAQELVAEQAIPQAEYDAADARWRSSAAEERMAHARLAAVTSGIEEAKAALGETVALLGYSKLEAPFAGRVLERLVDEGALAAPGTPLFVLADDGRPRVEAALPESHAADVKLGTPVSVEVEGVAAPLAGTVGEIVPNVDPASRALLVKIDLPPSGPALTPGAFARVLFAVGTRASLTVPATALSRFGPLDRVFVVEDGVAHLRMVTVGPSAGGLTRVLSGLSSGEQVVSQPPAELRDGRRVRALP